MEGKLRVARTRLRQQAGGRVVAHRGKSVGGKPGDVTAAAAADVGGRARPEEPPHDGVQVRGRRLLVPVLREGGGAGVVGASVASSIARPSAYCMPVFWLACSTKRLV